jgi:hypothetical protein
MRFIKGMQFLQQESDYQLLKDTATQNCMSDNKSEYFHIMVMVSYG